MDTTTGQGAWSEVAHTASGSERMIKVNDLKPLHKYRFRVKAVNKIGPSDATEMTGDDILMKDPWGDPLLLRWLACILKEPNYSL